METHISFSKMKTYRRCPQAFHYKYNEKLRRKRMAAPLMKGKILHEMIDAKFEKKDPYKVLAEYDKKYRVLFREEQEMYGDLIGDLRRIFSGYERQYSEDQLEYEASEELITTELSQGVQFIGYIDKRARDKHKRRWLVEHKSAKTIPDDDRRFSDLQSIFYIWAYNRNHPETPIDGILWDYIRTKPPVIPDMLKNGQLSQRKNMDTDYHTYLTEVRRLGLNPAGYQEILTQLKNEENTFFRRIFLPTPPKTMIDQVVEDMRRTAILIARLGDSATYRNMNHECASSCEFYSLCQAELRGLDSDFVRKTEYRIEEDTQRNGNQEAK